MLDLEYDNVTMADTLDEITEAVVNKKKKCISFINAHYLNVSINDSSYRQALNSSDLLLPDGSGVHLAGKMLGLKIKENVNGTDLLPLLCAKSSLQKMSFFLLGAQPRVAEEMSENLLKIYPGLDIRDTHHGYFNSEGDTSDIIQRINNSQANILLVGLGAPQQEKWIQKNKDALGVNVILGVGGLFDFYSGRKKTSATNPSPHGPRMVFSTLLGAHQTF